MFICNTYYQMITAIQLRYTHFSTDDTYIILTDHSKDAREVSRRLQKAECFNEVYYAEVKSLDQDKHGIATAACSILSGVTGRAEWMKEIEELRCDELIYFNLSISTLHLFALLNSNNPCLKCSRMEEGILSYNAMFHDGDGDMPLRARSIMNIRNILKKKNMVDTVDSFYCFYPELYTGKLNCIKIPTIKRNSKTANELKKIFSSQTKYRQKYIFFTSVYDFEGGFPVGEYELVTKVADLVGKDNLLVKMHPRDTRTIYRENGFCVDKDSSIPWEAIQLSSDFSEKVFMTINSGSVLAGSLMAERPVRTHYMFKLCDISNNESCKINARDIESLLNQGKMKSVFRMVKIAEKLDDII